MKLLALLREACRKFVHAHDRQVDQQLGEVELRVHVVATVGGPGLAFETWVSFTGPHEPNGRHSKSMQFRLGFTRAVGARVCMGADPQEIDA